MELKYVALAVGVVALIGLGAYAPTMLGPATTGTGTSSTACTSTTAESTASTSSQSSSTTTPASTTEGSFSSTPSSPVKVLSVAASTSQGAGQTAVSFAVTYENVGQSDVYTVVGCGSGLVASLPPGTTVLQKVTQGPVCLCDEAMTPVSPGQNRTSYTPGCWSGYQFLLVHPGTAQVDFTLSWGSNSTFQQGGQTNITAYFAFG